MTKMTKTFPILVGPTILALAFGLAAQTPGRAAPPATATRAANAAQPLGPVRLARTPQDPTPPGAPDLTRQPTLYVVGYTHLDTEWRWDYPQVIGEYLANTLHQNFDLIDKYPHYVFNFTGSNRYMMFKEYYPADYARLKQYIAEGRWFPGGASVEENDVNAPNAESIIRQVLYGNEFFRQEFGKAAVDYMLPDCFGFPASLPSILSHAGLIAFSTQKLSSGWQPAPLAGGPASPEKTPEGIPFNVGIWTGPDGASIIGALNPGSYGSRVTTDLSTNPLPELVPYADGDNPVDVDGKVSGLYADYHYVGTGDVGGAPDEESVKLMEAIIDKKEASLPPPGRGGRRGQPPPPPTPPVQLGEGPVHVEWADTDTMFLDMRNDDLSRLPRVTGDLELINHSTGSLTSEGIQKRFNRKNEVLANAAEEASVAAMLMDGRTYPLARLNYAWRLLLGGQFHDLMAGTADPGAYTYAWNDDTIAANQFSVAITAGSAAVADSLDTAGSGVPLVVYNSLNVAREDPVEADVNLGAQPAGVRVTGPDGREVPAQLDSVNGNEAHIVFIASVPAVGYAVYHVSAADAAPAPADSALHVTQNTLENARYRITLDQAGDVSSLFDKKLNKELLWSPMRLEFLTERPSQWPAWNMDWKDAAAPPRAYVAGPAQVQIVENGPARVALAVSRDAEGSHVVQTVRLAADSDRVEFAESIDWKTAAAALKAVFPLTAAAPTATYNWDIGTIQREDDNDRKFEVASHQWVDLTDHSGSFGATLLTDTKNGSDKPDDNTLRLTLLYTPGLNPGGSGYPDQATQDWGHHEILFGLAGHAGDWRQAHTDWQGYRLDAPLLAFATTPHAGALGRTFSLLSVNSDHLRVLALKRAEDSNDIVVRLVETEGLPTGPVTVGFPTRIVSAREVNGQEQVLDPATVTVGKLATSFTPYQPRSFELHLAAPAQLGPDGVLTQAQVALTYDQAVATRDGEASNGGGFDAAGDAMPAEMLPATVDYEGVTFKLAPGGAGRNDAVTAKGQTITLPAGNFSRLYILAAADGDQTGTFQVGDRSTDLNIENWTGFIGQWDYRSWQDEQFPAPAYGGRGRGGAAAANAAPRMRTVAVYAGLSPGYIKRAPLAWFASHHHTADGQNVDYSYSYLFAYTLDLPAGANTLTLPNNDKIRVLAMTVARAPSAFTPVQPLYDVYPYPNLTDSDRALLYGPGTGPDVDALKELPPGRGGGR